MEGWNEDAQHSQHSWKMAGDAFTETHQKIIDVFSARTTGKVMCTALQTYREVQVFPVTGMDKQFALTYIFLSCIRLFISNCKIAAQMGPELTDALYRLADGKESLISHSHSQTSLLPIFDNVTDVESFLHDFNQYCKLNREQARTHEELKRLTKEIVMLLCSFPK